MDAENKQPSPLDIVNFRPASTRSELELVLGSAPPEYDNLSATNPYEDATTDELMDRFANNLTESQQLHGELSPRLRITLDTIINEAYPVLNESQRRSFYIDGLTALAAHPEHPALAVRALERFFAGNRPYRRQI